MKKFLIVISIVLIFLCASAIVFVKYNALHTNNKPTTSSQSPDNINFTYFYPENLHQEIHKIDYTNGAKQAYQNGKAYYITLLDSNEQVIYFIDAHSDDFSDWLTEDDTYNSLKKRCNEQNNFIIGCKELNINGIPMIMISEEGGMEGSLLFQNFVVFRNENSEYKNVLIYFNLPSVNSYIEKNYDATTANPDLLNVLDRYGKNILSGKYESFSPQDQKVLNGFQDLIKSIKLK